MPTPLSPPNSVSLCVCSDRYVLQCQVIKLYAWEKPFHAAVMALRDQETASLLRASNYKAVNDGLFLSAAPLMLLCTFLPYVALGNALTPAAVFPTMALYAIVRLSVTNFVPRAIEAAAEARYDGGERERAYACVHVCMCGCLSML
jgi:hypothetical protein